MIKKSAAAASTTTNNSAAPAATSAAAAKLKKITSPQPKSVDYYDDFGAEDGGEYDTRAYSTGAATVTAGGAGAQQGKPVKRNLSMASAGFASASGDYYEGMLLQHPLLVASGFKASVFQFRGLHQLAEEMQLVHRKVSFALLYCSILQFLL